jgi:hypothetical protein
VADAPNRIELGVTPATIRTVRLGAVAIMTSLALPGAGLLVARTQPMVLALGGLSLALFALGLWSSSVCFAARGYRRAMLPVLTVIAGLMLAVAFVYWSVLVEGAQLLVRGRVRTPWAWPVLLPTVVALTALIVFAARAIQFGREGGAIWTAIGVLHILSAGAMLALCFIYAGVTVLAVVPMNFNLVGLSVVLGFVAVLVYPAALICHAIGLFKATGQLEAMRALGTAFD